MATGVGRLAAVQRPAPKPSVLLILTDDQGYGDLSCHGNPRLKTPSLDRLHAESVRLTESYDSANQEISGAYYVYVERH